MRPEDSKAGFDGADRRDDEPMPELSQHEGLPTTEPPAFIEKEASRSSHKNIGPYKILQKIGEGGMGAVFMAEQNEPVRRRVALKVISIKLMNKSEDVEKIVARFEAERQALAMMNHPNIAKVLDVGKSEEGAPYFAMELVKGIPLTEYCDKNKLSIAERLRLFLPVCKAIQHAHQKGIIHRDLKPSNVLVAHYDGDPVPKVIDFGLAKATDHQARLTDKTMFTEFGQIVGTIQYMSPEQAEMNQLDVDTRTDIYSLGVMLYELLTGSTPLDRETLGQNALLQVLELIREKEPPRPSTRLSSAGESATGISAQRKIQPAKLRQILRGELDWIVMKALEKDRKRRYESATAFADDIQRFLEDEAVSARPPSTWYRCQKFARKNRSFVISLTCIAVLLLVSSIVSAWLAFDRDQARIAAEDQKTEAINQKKRADNLLNVAQESARQEKNANLAKDAAIRRAVDAENVAKASDARSKIQLASLRWNSGRVKDAKRLLKEIPVEFRDTFEWRFCSRLFQGSDETWYGLSDVKGIAISPDGKWVACGGATPGKDSIAVWDANTGKLERMIEDAHQGWVESLHFHPTRDLLLSAGFDKSIKIWDLKKGRSVKTIRLKEIPNGARFSPDGKWIAESSIHFGVKIWDWENSKEVTSLPVESGQVSCIAYRPDGAWLAYALGNEIKLWDTESGKVLQTLQGHTNRVEDLCFSPDGRRLVSASSDRTIRVWDIGESKALLVLEGHTEDVKTVACSPDNTTIVSGGADQTIRSWDLQTGKELTRLHGHSAEINRIAITPDGKRIVSGGDEEGVKIWSIKTDSQAIELSNSNRNIEGLAVSPDGSRIASAIGSSGISIWDVKSSAVFKTLKEPRANFHRVVFHPSLSMLASIGSHDKVIKIWDLGSGQVIRTLEGHQEWVQSVAISPDGSTIVSGAIDEVRVWDFASGELNYSIKHPGWVESVAIHPDGSTFASEYENTVRIWNTKTGKEVFRLEDGRRNYNFLTFGKKGKLLAAADGTEIVVWSLDDQKVVARLGGHEQKVGAITFLQNDTRIISGSGTRFFGSADNSIKIWDVATGSELVSLDHYPDSIVSAWVSEKEDRFICATGEKIKIWPLLHFGSNQIHKINSIVYESQISSDGKHVAYCDQGQLQVLNLDTGSISSFRELPSESESEMGFDISFDSSSRLLGFTDDHTSFIWNIETGEEVLTFPTEQLFSELFACQSGPLVLLVDLADPDRIRIWDYQKKKETVVINQPGMVDVDISKDWTKLWTLDEKNQFILWELVTGEKLTEFKVHPSFYWADIPTGNRIVVEFHKGFGLLRDAKTGAPIRKIEDTAVIEKIKSLPGSGNPSVEEDEYAILMHKFAFSPDGSRLAFVRKDNTIAIWSQKDNSLVAIKGLGAGNSYIVSFNPEGTELYTQTDRVKQVWDTETGKERTDAHWNGDAYEMSGDTVTPNRRWKLVYENNTTTLINREFADDNRVAQYRRAKLRLDRYWRWKLAERAKQNGNPLAETFHSAWILKAMPQSKVAFERFKLAFGRLQAMFVDQDGDIESFLPPIIKEMRRKHLPDNSNKTDK